MAKFLFAVSGQVLDLLTTTKGVADTVEVNYAEFEFRSSEWNECANKWAHFTCPDFRDGEMQSFELIDDKISPERGLNLPAGIWEVFLTGEVIVNNGEVIKRYVTCTQTIQIIPSNIVNADPLSQLEASVAEQIDGRATAALDARITTATVDIDGGTGEPGCEVDITGEPRTKSLNFHFHNIRGIQGPRGDSGIYIGTEEPTEEGINVWVDPAGLIGKVINEVSYTGDHTPGTNDHLILDFSDGTSLDIRIYNGADGEGTGDMLKAAYDPNNNATDIFEYADDAAEDAADALAATLAAVATSGSYNDLSDTPPDPEYDSTLSSSSENAVQNKVVKAALDNKQDTLTIDTSMSDSSTNTVQNKIIKAYVDANAGKPVIVQYSLGTYATIQAAVTAGKEVLLYLSGTDGYARLVEFTTTKATFSRTIGKVLYTYEVTNANVWSYSSATSLTSSDVDTTVSSSSGNPIANNVMKSYVDTLTSGKYYFRDYVFNLGVYGQTGGCYVNKESISSNALAVSGYTLKGVLGCWTNQSSLLVSAGMQSGSTGITVWYVTNSAYTGSSIPVTLKLLYEKN